MESPRPQGRFRRLLQKLVLAETVYSFWERGQEAWGAIPRPVRFAIKAAILMLLSDLGVRVAVIRDWLTQAAGAYLSPQTILMVILLSLWAIIAILVRRERRSKMTRVSTEAPTQSSSTTASDTPGPEQHAPYEAVEKLREIITPCMELLRAASSFYSQVFANTWGQAHASAGIRQTPHDMSEDLFRGYELSPFQQTVTLFERSSTLKLLQGTGRLTQQQFTEVLLELCQALAGYEKVMRRLHPIVEIFGTDESDLLSSREYLELYNLHSKCGVILGVASQRGDLRPLRKVLPTVELDKPTIAVPRLILGGDDAFFVKRVEFKAIKTSGEKRTFVLDVLTMRLLNQGRRKGVSLAARDLEVEFTCEGPGVALPWISSRLDDSIEPPLLRPGERPERVFRLEAFESRPLNLVVKSPSAINCYLFNNESYQYPDAQNPAWSMPPGEYRCLVKVSGIDVRESFECVFENHGEGLSLEVKSFRSLLKEREA